MANLASSRKNIRKSARRRIRNKSVLERIRAQTKKETELSAELQKLIDKAAKEGIIHRNRAARLKSRLAKTQ